ncbi:leucine-rich repeat extensin-like protein 5 [Phragmites australis]|uniref:leucine-rich repeat extensin-like protein 5 n=1 Tax=Phragmites australis TaxID=29695 RepID=UPI002D7836B7|nr:leucine-rich repeat extensin-like protein 5 [Phragmites australis]
MSSASHAGAGGRRITIRSISCRGVRSFVPFQKPPLYAAVSLGGRREETPPDPNGGENPDWDGAVLAFDIDGDGQAQLLQIEVKAQVPFLGNKLVGTAGVPVAGLAAGGRGGDGASLRHVSYQVSAPDGKPNGTLSFAYAISGAAGGVRPQPQIYPVPDGAQPEQNPSLFCAPPPSAAYPAPATANFAPHSGGYPLPPPPVSASLYPPLQDLFPSNSYPSPPPHPMRTNPHFAAPNSSSYPPPAAPVTTYPPAPASCTACPAPPAQYITSYPPPPPTNYPPPPPSGYPPPAFNLAPPTSTYPPPPPSGYPPPASNLAPPTSTYPPPPPPDSGSTYPVLPSTVDRALPYYPPPPDAAITYPPPPGGSYYPLLGTQHPELDGAPPPGTRYS